MNTPGISLFQGAESINVNSNEIQEEEEALIDRRRREEELGKLFQNAFNDLDDDETTIDSTTNFQSDLMDKEAQQHHQQQSPQHLPQHLQQYANDPDHGYANNHAPLDHTACEAEIHKLRILAESQQRELDHTQHLLTEEFKKRNDLEKKLTITEADLDLALTNKKNNHELLVECKEKCSNLENTLQKMKTERKSLEEENNSLLGKLETAQTLLSDVQRKYDMVEKGLNKNEERNFEIKRKQMEDRHRAAFEVLQQKLEQVGNKLDKKTNELENINTRYEALRQTYEMMLCDKASRIDELSHNLDQEQNKCHDLLSRPDYFHENVRLQKLIASLQEQIKSMEMTIKSLTERLEMTTAELDDMDSVLHQYNLEETPRIVNVKSKRENIRILQQTLKEKQAETRCLKQEENKSLVQISTLKEENMRLDNKLRVVQEDYENLKSSHQTQTKQDEENNHIQSLQNELENLKSQQRKLKEENLQLEQQKSSLELERKKLDSQLKNLEIDLEELKQEHASLKLNYEQIFKENLSLKQRQTADNIRLELEKHKFLLKDSQAECERLKNLYVEICNAKEALSYEMEKILNSDQAKDLQAQKEKVANLQRALQLAELRTSELSKILETEKLCHERELSTLKDKLEKEKLESFKAAKEAANECTKCMEYVAELTKFEIQNLKLTNINSVSKKEIDELTNELKTSKEHIAELNEQLKLSEHQEHLIKELKTKSTQFEEYIKTQSSLSEASTNSSKNSKQWSDKSVTTSPDLERNGIKKIESRIRDEMAKIFAVELKRFQSKIQQTQEQSLCLQREYQHINTELQQRQTEVDLLKQAILAEREKMEEILKQKDDEYKEVIQKQNVFIQKSRDELQTKGQKIKELTHELNERQTQIEAERQSMKAVMKQWEEQRKSLDAVEMDWKQKFKDLQKAHEISIQLWHTKYNSAKRTAANYKRYSEDKEAHMLKEYDRLKIEYDAQLAKIQLRMKENLEKKNLELKQALDKQRTGLNNNNKENTVSN